MGHRFSIGLRNRIGHRFFIGLRDHMGHRFSVGLCIWIDLGLYLLVSMWKMARRRDLAEATAGPVLTART